MTVLVTGGAGYIGSHFVHELVGLGEGVVVLDDLSVGHGRLLPKQVPLIIGDCADLSLLSSVFGEHKIKSIVHFAGSIVVPESIEKPLLYYSNNTAKTRALIEAAVLHKIPHFIFSSTAAVYGYPDKTPIDEEARTNPVSPYGRSKLMSELMLADAGLAHGIKYAVLRYFNVAGADPQLRTGQSTRLATHLIKIAVQTALGTRTRMNIYGTDYPTSDGTCIRDYIHVADLAQAHVKALRYLRGGGESITLNCGYGRGASVFEVIEAVRRISGKAVPVELAARRPGDPAILVASANRAKVVLDWRPRFQDLDAIIEHALAWEENLLNHPV